MSGRPSRRNKTQPARSQATVPVVSDMSEDVSEATETDGSIENQLQASGTRYTPEADRENKRSSSSVQPSDNSLRLVDETDSKKNTAGQRARASAGDRLTKRHRTENSEADKDKQPAAKQSKRTKDTKTVPALHHTTTVEMLQDKETTESEGECEMEIDDNEELTQENNEQTAYRATASESDLPAIPTMKPIVQSRHHQQKQTSSGMHSSARSRDVWISSNAISHSSRSSSSFEPRRRALAPQLHDASIQERQQKLLPSYDPRYTDMTSAVGDRTPEIVEQDSDNCCRKLRSLLKYFLTISVLIVSAVLIALLVTTGEEPYHSEWVASIKQLASVKSGEMDDIPVSIDALFERLGREFPSQTGRLWRILEAATLPLIEEDNPTHPAVVLLVAAKGSGSVAECLAGRYAMLVTNSLKAAAAAAASPATFDCASYADSDADDVKRQLDSVLSRAFDAGSKSGVVLRLQKLRGSAPMILYRFADNDNAAYKDVAIVLTLSLQSTDVITGSERDDVAYDELRRVWGSSLDADQLEPLLSRIGNSVAFVRPETANALVENGC